MMNTGLSFLNYWTLNLGGMKRLGLKQVVLTDVVSRVPVVNPLFLTLKSPPQKPPTLKK